MRRRWSGAPKSQREIRRRFRCAEVKAEGRSGIRHIRIREHHVLSDSPYDFAGYNLGPSSPELQLGVLGSCLTHIFLIQAAISGVPLEELSVEVTGQIDPRGGTPGHDDVPVYPQHIGYTVQIRSSASETVLAELHRVVERVCPILNLLVNPQQITGTLVLLDSVGAGTVVNQAAVSQSM